MCFGCVNPAVTEDPSERILVLDCDDTLYRNDFKMMNALTQNMDKYCTEKLGLEGGICYKLYKEHGTSLLGLLQKGLITEDKIDDWLETTHTFPNEGRDLVKPDEKLRKFLQQVKVEKFIFTASTQVHAERCCRALGVDDLMLEESRPICDTRRCKLKTKYSAESFETCVNMMSDFLKKDVNPKDLVFCDDNLKNIQCAKKCGWGVCVLMGAEYRGTVRTTELEGVDYVIEHLSELESIEELQDLYHEKDNK